MLILAFLRGKTISLIPIDVTGLWKTDQIVTLGLFHFISPANGYTCTLHIHSTVTRLGELVYFSRASFANPVNSWLRQWDPWGMLYGRHGSEIHPSDGETSLTPFKHVWTYGWHFWDLYIASPNSLNGRFNPPPASYPSPPPTQPPPITRHQWYYSSFEKVAENPAV